MEIVLVLSIQEVQWKIIDVDFFASKEHVFISQ